MGMGGKGWNRKQNGGGCVLVIRQAKKCVKKIFISDSYCCIECYFFPSCDLIIVLNCSLTSSVPALYPSLVV